MGINLGPSINVKGQTTRLDRVQITLCVLTFVDKINNHVMFVYHVQPIGMAYTPEYVVHTMLLGLRIVL